MIFLIGVTYFEPRSDTSGSLVVDLRRHNTSHVASLKDKRARGAFSRIQAKQFAQVSLATYAGQHVLFDRIDLVDIAEGIGVESAQILWLEVKEKRAEDDPAFLLAVQ
jgi:hypothetical protein